MTVDGTTAGGGARPPVVSRRRRQSFRSLLAEIVRRERGVVCIDPKRRRYLVTAPDDVKHVLQDNHANYRQLTPKRPLMGHESLTMSTGDRWRQRRRLMQPLFHPQRVGGLAPHMSAAAAAMVERWQDAADARRPLDVAGEMVRFSLESLIASFFGDDGGADLCRAVNDAFHYFDARLRRGFLVPLWLPTRGNRQLKAALEEMKVFLRRVIAERRAGGEDRGDLLSMLLLARDQKSGASMSDRQVLDELMMLLVMGHMTTAMALTWTWYLLAEHPGVDRRLAAELAAELEGRPPAVEDLPRLVYTRRVIDEALRLYPSTWLFTRGAEGPDVVGGYAIPAGSQVWISPFATHRRDDLWPDPEVFDPDRFLPERSGGRHRFAYFPFGGGPRACIANAFAPMEMMLLVAEVARRYRLDLPPRQPVEVMAAITLQPRRGLPMILRPR